MLHKRSRINFTLDTLDNANDKYDISQCTHFNITKHKKEVLQLIDDRKLHIQAPNIYHKVPLMYTRSITKSKVTKNRSKFKKGTPI